VHGAPVLLCDLVFFFNSQTKKCKLGQYAVQVEKQSTWIKNFLEIGHLEMSQESIRIIQ